jgi:hypothetical protein
MNNVAATRRPKTSPLGYLIADSRCESVRAPSVGSNAGDVVALMAEARPLEKAGITRQRKTQNELRCDRKRR